MRRFRATLRLQFCTVACKSRHGHARHDAHGRNGFRGLLLQLRRHESRHFDVRECPSLRGVGDVESRHRVYDNLPAFVCEVQRHFALGEHRDVEEVDVVRSPENLDFFLRESGPLRKAARSARNAGLARLERLVVVEAHVASDSHHGVKRDALLLGDVCRDGAHERHVPVVVRGTRLTERGVTQTCRAVGTCHRERVHLATSRTVGEYGAKHRAHLRRDERIENHL